MSAAQGPRPLVAGRSAAVQLPEPEQCVLSSRAVIWAGGVAVHGTTVCAPGRYSDDLGVIRAQAAAMLAACEVAEENGRTYAAEAAERARGQARVPASAPPLRTP